MINLEKMKTEKCQRTLPYLRRPAFSDFPPSSGSNQYLVPIFKKGGWGEEAGPNYAYEYIYIYIYIYISI